MRKRIKCTRIFDQKDINKVMLGLPDMSIVIGAYVPLRESGSDYVGPCPLCRAKTLNDSYFRVSDRKGLYKCFQCGAGGTNSVSFMMRYFNLPFDEVLFFLNKKYLGLEFGPIRIKSCRRHNIDDDLPF